MIRTDDSCFLLFIEPKKWRKRLFPKNDIITKIMQLALFEAKKDTLNYMFLKEVPSFLQGSNFYEFHTTKNEKIQKTNLYLLENGMITNKLCIYYLKYYRRSIPKSEMLKVNKIVDYYLNKYKSKSEIIKKLQIRIKCQNNMNEMIDNILSGNSSGL